MDSLWIILIFCTVFLVLLHSCFKASQTEENASSTPAPPPPSFSRSHQLRQNGNAELNRQHKNFERSSKYVDLVKRVELLEANTHYALIKDQRGATKNAFGTRSSSFSNQQNLEVRGKTIR